MHRLLVCLVLVLEVPSALGNLKIWFIDVGQDDATLIVSPKGESLLIDSGKNNMGERIHAVMRNAGINAVDCFISTHYHEDH